MSTTTMKTARIIQIATVPEGENILPCLVALMEDGTVWSRPIFAEYESDLVWKKMPSPPSAGTPKPRKKRVFADLRTLLESELAANWPGIMDNPHPPVRRARIVNTVTKAMGAAYGCPLAGDWSVMEKELGSRLANGGQD